MHFKNLSKGDSIFFDYLKTVYILPRRCFVPKYCISESPDEIEFFICVFRAIEIN